MQVQSPGQEDPLEEGMTTHFGILAWRISCVGTRVRHYWQNRGTALNPLPLFRRHGPGMKELGFVILTCFFLSSAELTEENIKVLIVFERSIRRHKAFCSCAQRIIHKVNHWHLFKDFYKKVFQREHTGHSLRPWEGLLSEAYLWGKCYGNREGNGTPLQYSCLGNPMDGGAW